MPFLAHVVCMHCQKKRRGGEGGKGFERGLYRIRQTTNDLARGGVMGVEIMSFAIGSSSRAADLQEGYACNL